MFGNLDHQNPSSVRRDGEALSIANHIKKEEQLRQKLESERASKKEQIGKLNEEKEEIKQKTKMVVEMFKKKLSEVELDLSASRFALQNIESRSHFTNSMLREHLNKWRAWHQYVQKGDLESDSALEGFAEYVISQSQPMKFLTLPNSSASPHLGVLNAAQLPSFLISELDVILQFNNNPDLLVQPDSMPYLLVDRIIDTDDLLLPNISAGDNKLVLKHQSSAVDNVTAVLKEVESEV